jgi:hypothetical protein
MKAYLTALRGGRRIRLDLPRLLSRVLPSAEMRLTRLWPCRDRSPANPTGKLATLPACPKTMP